MAVDLNRENYEKEVSEPTQTVLVDFWGPQCVPCLALNPTLEKIEEQYTEKLKVCKVNATENRMLCVGLRVLGLPTFILYKDGNEVNRITGDDINEKGLIEAVEAVIE